MKLEKQRLMTGATRHRKLSLCISLGTIFSFSSLCLCFSPFFFPRGNKSHRRVICQIS